MLSFHQDPTKLKIFDLCWRKLILKFCSRFFSVEISKNRKIEKQGFQLKIFENRNFLKSWFSKNFKWNPCFFDFSIFDFSIFRNFRPKKILEPNFKINFLQHRSKFFNLVGSWWKLNISSFQRTQNHCQRSSDAQTRTVNITTCFHLQNSTFCSNRNEGLL